jgi:hypothetical protein
VFIVPVAEKSWRRLHSLYVKMVHFIPQPCNLNNKAFRLPVSLTDTSRRRLKLAAAPTSATKLVQDGEFIRKFLLLSRVHQMDFAKAIGSSIERVLEDVWEITQLTDLF